MGISKGFLAIVSFAMIVTIVYTCLSIFCKSLQRWRMHISISFSFQILRREMAALVDDDDVYD